MGDRPSSAATDSRPNVVVVLLDTVRADHLSCYGYERNTMPFVDSVASDGVVYERAYSTSIWSLPAYASLFTGAYPSEHGAVDWSRKIDENEITSTFQNMGYSTAAVSPHLVSGEFGIRDGFDVSEWVSVASRDFPFEDDPVIDRVRERKEAGGWDSEVRKYADILRWLLTERSVQTVPNGLYHLYQSLNTSMGRWTDQGADEVVSESKQIVDRMDRPYFLFANFIEPHAPYRPPGDYWEVFLDDRIAFDEVLATLDKFSNTTDLILGDAELTENERDIIMALYDAELRYLDSKVQELIEHVRDTGDTVVCLLSDHGELFGERGLWSHQGRIHQDLCRIPLIVDYPWADGTRESGVVDLVDVSDHLVEIAYGGTDVLRPSGEAFVEYYGWDTQLSTKPWESYTGTDADRWEAYQVALFDDRYEVFWDATGTFKLRDQTRKTADWSDLPEDADLADRYKRRIESMFGSPRANHAQYRQSAEADQTIDADEAMQQHLQDLGYLEE